MFGQLPSKAGAEVSLHLLVGSNGERVYTFITPFGTSRTFAKKSAAMTFARRHGWVVKEAGSARDPCWKAGN